MDATTIETIRSKPDREQERRGYPEGFPPLPPVPARRYCDPTFLDLERRYVFGRSWLFVAHDDELPEVGDYVRLDAVPEPIFLVRGDDGTVKAFYNTCQHRGSALVTDHRGHAGRRVTCPYHGWVYTLDGKLAGYPDAGNFCDLDTDCLALPPVRCESWGPFLFVNLDPQAPPLLEWLRPVSDDLAEFGSLTGRCHLVGTRRREVPGNWKLPVDANIETYHVNVVHRESAAKFIDQAKTGIWLLRHGHSRMLIRTRDAVGTLPDVLPPLVTTVGDLPRQGVFSYHAFPNLSIVFSSPGFLFFITNWPTSPTTCRYDVHFFSSLAPADDTADLNPRILAANEEVLWEDLAVLPGMQASIDAGSLPHLTLSYQERRIYHLHENIDRHIGVEQVPADLRVPAVLGPFIES